jgi:hypothetical protein
MWQDRLPEVRALRPKLIRLFLQEYFDPLPQTDRYHWATMDESVDLIRKTGASPLMCITFKPRVLYPKIDQNIVHPASYTQWEKLIHEMVRHYKQRGSGIRYWEIGNEPDIGEDGGCPYKFTPEDYVTYYRHTTAAILRADPDARVGGPALANVRSPILPALLEAAAKATVPLHFISWHRYADDPKGFRAGIDFAKGLVAKHASLRLETMITEWNMALSDPPENPRIQPCFVAEATWQMKEGGLEYAAYYHIRDWHVEPRQFAEFMSPGGLSLYVRWWNRLPEFDGMFDFQNYVRPVYFLFKLFSRMTGNRAPLSSTDEGVHGFATRDDDARTDQVLLWNYSPRPAAVKLAVDGVWPGSGAQRITLDATAASGDENARLRRTPRVRVQENQYRSEFEIEPYGVSCVWLERR